MSLFHMYAAVAIVPAQVLRPVHVGFMLLLVFLLFPITPRFRNRLMPWDVVLALVGVATHRLSADGRRRLLGPQHDARSLGSDLRHGVRPARARGGATHLGLDHARCRLHVHRLRFPRPVSAGAVDAPRLRPVEPGRLHVPDARGHLRHRDRRVVDPDHPVHDLRRVSAAFRRRQVLSSISPSRRWAASLPAPGAPSCWRRFCSAGRRAPAWRRR